ncbi:MAG TPA: hypothetical protein VGC86_04865 [Afipia sp.]
MIEADSKVISEIIGDIYESVYDPGRLNMVVASLQSLFHGSKACTRARLKPLASPSTAHRDISGMPPRPAKAGVQQRII